MGEDYVHGIGEGVPRLMSIVERALNAPGLAFSERPVRTKIEGGLSGDAVVDRLLRTGLPVRKDGRPADDPNMSPVKAHGIFTDIGEYRKMLKSDGLVKGFSSKYTSDVKSAQMSLIRHADMTVQEQEAYIIVANLFGVANENEDEEYRPILAGGLRRLLGIADKSREYGFSIIECRWGAVEIDGKTRVVPVEYGYRRSSSINRVFYDAAGNPIAVEQVLQREPLQKRETSPESVDRTVEQRRDFVVIPLDRCVRWVFDADEGEFEGSSQLRAAYGWHKAKMQAVKKYLQLQGRLTDGVTLIEEQGTKEGVYAEVSQRDIEGLATMLERFYSGDSSYLLTPYGVKLTHSFPASKMEPPVELLGYCDAQMLMAMGAFLFGFGAVRSGAPIVDSVYEMMRSQVKSTIEDYLGVVNDWIAQIIDANMQVEDGFRYPRYNLASFTMRSLESMVSLMTRAAQFLLVTVQPEDEARFRKVAGMVNFSVDEVKKAREKVAEKAGQMSQQGSQSSQGGQSSPDAARADAGKGGDDEQDEDKKEEKGE